MAKHARPKRTLAKKITVYCEGDTEKNYVNGLRAHMRTCDDSVRIRVEPVPLGGGGYEPMVKKLRQAPDSNCVARVVLFDLDRYLNNPSEGPAFEEMLRISRESTRRRIPCVLVISNPKFEYALCCHDSRYAEQAIEAFLRDEWNYRTLADCKNDTRVWDKANAAARSYEQALQHLEGRPCPLKNALKVVKQSFTVSLTEVSFDADRLAGSGSNLKDLFKVIGLV